MSTLHVPERDPSAPADPVLEAAPGPMPFTLTVVIGLHVLAIAGGLFALLFGDASWVEAGRVVWWVALVWLLLRGSDGARMFVRFSGGFTAVVGILALSIAVLAGEAGALLGLGLVFLAIGGFTYVVLGADDVQTWMANRLLVRLDDVTSPGTRP